MRTNFLFVLLALFAISATNQVSFAQTDAKAKKMVEEMVNAVGGVENFYKLRDVKYDLNYDSPGDGPDVVGEERYIFDGELSQANLTEHGFLGMKNISEGFDGQNFWVKHNGAPMNDEKAIGMATFLRKTNYYWFAMMFKMLDPGLNYKYLGEKKLGKQGYDVVEVTFDEQVGAVQDTYVLYINQDTHLVDQFLFTVMAMGAQDPFLMKVQYEEIDGIKVPSSRKYAKSTWDGTHDANTNWINVTWSNIEFNNGFERTAFKG